VGAGESRVNRAGRVGLAGAMAAAAWLAAVPQAGAYAFGVSPIRLDFNRDARTGAVTVSNDDRVRLSFQVRLVRWTQDAAGQDVYEDSKDLVYFPRLMTVEPQDKRVIRVGTQAGPGPTERTYRLIVEELAPPAAERDAGTTVAVRMRFAIPLFVAPAEPAGTAELRDVAVHPGEVRLVLANPGNRHVKAESIVLRRGGTVVAESAGWYVLAGAARGFSVALPPAECERGGVLVLAVTGTGLALERELRVDAGACRP
jgi:fimbrial chaperone protein